MRAFHS